MFIKQKYYQDLFILLEISLYPFFKFQTMTCQKLAYSMFGK